MPITNIDNPLTETNYRELNRGLNMISQVRRKIELAEQAGNDMEPYHTSVNLLEKRLQQTKQVYFPDKP